MKRGTGRKKKRGKNEKEEEEEIYERKRKFSEEKKKILKFHFQHPLIQIYGSNYHHHRSSFYKI